MNPSKLPSNIDKNLRDKFQELVSSMTEDEQKLVITFMIIYVSEHPEILTKTAREHLEALEHSEFANSTAPIIEED